MEAAGPCSKKRKSAGLGSLEAGAGNQDQEPPPLPGAEGGGDDRISDLPDAVLGEIISLVSTKEGARTQVLASRWRRLWHSAPLNLHYHPFLFDKEAFDVIISRVLAAHPGPGRRFCAPLYHLHGDRADALLRSPSLDNLHELELCSFTRSLPFPPATRQPAPMAAFRFSDTLRAATIGSFHLTDSAVQALHFPKLQKLALKMVSISESSLHTMIAACPALECLLIQNCTGFRCVRINSTSIGSIGVGGYNYREELKFGELVIENAPCLQSLLQLGSSVCLDIAVISAPKLEALGYLSASRTRFVFESTIIQSDGPGKTNVWRRKHRSLIKSLDIRLKTIVWRHYRGIKSHVDFATFFLLNARVLELMIFEVNDEHYNEPFFAQQRETLQVDSRASRGARLCITSNWSYNYMMNSSVHDLDPADPFERRCPLIADTSFVLCGNC